MSLPLPDVSFSFVAAPAPMQALTSPGDEIGGPLGDTTRQIDRAQLESN